MTVIDSKYRSELFRSAEAQGRAEGISAAKRDALLDVLDARGVDVPETVRAEVLACSDLDQLNTWFHRALKAASIDDVFSK